MLDHTTWLKIRLATDEPCRRTKGLTLETAGLDIYGLWCRVPQRFVRGERLAWQVVA